MKYSLIFITLFGLLASTQADIATREKGLNNLLDELENIIQAAEIVKILNRYGAYAYAIDGCFGYPNKSDTVGLNNQINVYTELFTQNATWDVSGVAGGPYVLYGRSQIGQIIYYASLYSYYWSRHQFTAHTWTKVGDTYSFSAKLNEYRQNVTQGGHTYLQTIPQDEHHIWVKDTDGVWRIAIFRVNYSMFGPLYGDYPVLMDCRMCGSNPVSTHKRSIETGTPTN